MSGGIFAPLVCIVDFHHARYGLLYTESFKLIACRGPEIEKWFGVEDGSDPAVENDWSYLPFMALSDGAHT